MILRGVVTNPRGYALLCPDERKAHDSRKRKEVLFTKQLTEPESLEIRLVLCHGYTLNIDLRKDVVRVPSNTIHMTNPFNIITRVSLGNELGQN